jgi:hypothetical protein
MKKIQTRTIVFSYPGFQALPSGVKRMLVVSESFFFNQESAAVKPCYGLTRIRGTLIER